jgi:hypothetical protein
MWLAPDSLEDLVTHPYLVLCPDENTVQQWGSLQVKSPLPPS